MYKEKFGIKKFIFSIFIILSTSLYANTVNITPIISFLLSDSSSTPVANAGADQNVIVGDDVVLDGSASIGTGDTLTYTWSFTSIPNGSSVSLNGNTTVHPTFTADEAGEYILSLVVNDGRVNSSPDTVVVNVEPIPPLDTSGNATLADFTNNDTFYIFHNFGQSSISYQSYAFNTLPYATNLKEIKDTVAISCTDLGDFIQFGDPVYGVDSFTIAYFSLSKGSKCEETTMLETVTFPYDYGPYTYAASWTASY